MKTLMSLVPMVAHVAVPLIALAIGMGAAAADLTWLWKRPGLLVRSLLAVLLVVPALAVALALGVTLPPAVTVGLLLIVVSVGPVVVVRKLKRLPADADYAVGLNLVLLTASLVWVPLAVVGIAALFGRDLDLPFALVARSVGLTQLLPLALGIAVGRLAPALTARVVRPLGIAANGAFACCVLVALLAFARPALSLGLTAYLCIAGLAVSAVFTGHLLGGPLPRTRLVLAAFSGLRFPLLAIAIASLTAQGVRALPTVVVYVVFSGVALIAYSAIVRLSDRRRQLHQPAVTSTASGHLASR